MSEQSKRFEKAKAEWLKKIGNRSLAEFHKDPKVIKMWADIDKSHEEDAEKD